MTETKNKLNVAEEKKNTKAKTPQKTNNTQTTKVKTTTKKVDDTKVAKPKIAAPKKDLEKTTKTKTTALKTANVKENKVKTTAKNDSKTSQEAIRAATKKITQISGPVVINKGAVKGPKKKDALSITETQKPKKEATRPKKETKVKETKPVVKTRKVKLETKEEKQAYAKLVESFNYVANLTWVIEEKMLDTKAVPDLTLGELHVLEVVNGNNGSSTTTIANALKVTVGSLITCVNRLIQKEYLIRLRDDFDKRVINLSVTPKAKKALKVHDKFHEEILLGVLEGVTVRDANKVMTQFVRVLENHINPKEKTNVIITTTNKKSSKNTG